MSKHTPGPWILTHISGSNFAVQRFEIRSGSGMPHPIFNKDTSAINGSSACMSPQDANLIAAAPDLLEALEMCIDWMGERRDVSPESIDAWVKGRYAIAKARGES